MYSVDTANKNTLLIGLNCIGPTNAVTVVKLALKNQFINHFSNTSSINHPVSKRNFFTLVRDFEKITLNTVRNKTVALISIPEC